MASSNSVHLLVPVQGVKYHFGHLTKEEREATRLTITPRNMLNSNQSDVGTLKPYLEELGQSPPFKYLAVSVAAGTSLVVVPVLIAFLYYN